MYDPLRSVRRTLPGGNPTDRFGFFADVVAAQSCLVAADHVLVVLGAVGCSCQNLLAWHTQSDRGQSRPTEAGRGLLEETRQLTEVLTTSPLADFSMTLLPSTLSVCGAILLFVLDVAAVRVSWRCPRRTSGGRGDDAKKGSVRNKDRVSGMGLLL